MSPQSEDMMQSALPSELGECLADSPTAELLHGDSAALRKERPFNLLKKKKKKSFTRN